MERIDPVGPRPDAWFHTALDPDHEDIVDRRTREERRRRERRARERPKGGRPGAPGGDDEPPHHIDVRA